MFLVLYKLWCFTFPLNHFGNLIQKICFSWCFYIWVEILSIRNYLAIVFSLNALNKCCFSGSHCLKLRGHGQEVVVSPALWTQSWSWMVEVVVSPALWMQLWSWVVEVVVGLALWIQSWSWAGDSCQSCIVNTVVVMAGGGSCQLCSFRIAFVDVTYVFIWIRISCLCFLSCIYEQRPHLEACFIKEKRLVSQGMAAYSQSLRPLASLYIWIWVFCVLSIL